MSGFSPKPLQKLTPEQADSSVRLYQEEHLSLAMIAKRFGVTRQSMHKFLMRRGVKMRPQRRYGKANHFFRGGAKAVDQAQNKLEKAIQRGKIKRPRRCQNCGKVPPRFRDGRTAIQAHHPDYAKPLQVEWLCQRCHHARHRSLHGM